MPPTPPSSKAQPNLWRHVWPQLGWFSKGLVGWALFQWSRARNWDWKVIIICFFTACTFWLFQSLNGEQNSDLEIPLRFEFARKDLVTLLEPPTHVTANVSGNGWSLFRKSFGIGLEPLVVTVKTPILSNAMSSDELLPFVLDRMKDMKVNYLVEDSIRFHFDTLVTKLVHLGVNDSSLAMANNCRVVSGFDIEPPNIEISVPSSMLATLPDTLLLQINDENIDEDYDNPVAIEYPKSHYTLSDHHYVRVRFDVERFVRKKLPMKLPSLVIKGRLATYADSDAYVSYYVKSNELLEPLDSIPVRIDPKSYQKQDSTVAIICDAPLAFHDLELHPSRIKVILR